MPSIRENCETRLAGMKSVRSDWEQDWKDVSRFAMPARSRFLNSDTNKGKRQRNSKLLDEYGVTSYRTLRNGMTSGLSSPSRPWKTLATFDADLMDEPEVKWWLSEVDRRMDAFLAQTNFYAAAKTGYHELGLFGTEAAVMVEHPVVGMVCHALTAGEYWIAMSDAMTPDTLYRRCPMTVRQAVQSFGTAVSERVRTAYDASRYEEMVEAFHAIEPDPDYVPGDIFRKPFRSVYWDEQDQKTRTLRVSGYHEQAFWATRWDTTGSDTYGNSPGIEGLPTLRELQLQVKRKNEAVDKLIKPEIIVPVGVRLTGQPGNTVSASTADKDGVIIPHKLDHQSITVLSAEIERVYRKIDTTSYADLFMAITNMQGIQPRNMEEIASRNEEKLTQLGPTIERVNTEKLGVAVDRVFGIMLRGNMLPPVPERLRNLDLKIDFVSILTQMQRMVGLGQIERSVSFIGGMLKSFPEASDKLNVDEVVDEYADRAGMPPKLIRSPKEVAQIRAQRQQQQQAEKMAATMPALKQAAEGAELLSNTDVGGRPMLDTLLGQ